MRSKDKVNCSFRSHICLPAIILERRASPELADPVSRMSDLPSLRQKIDSLDTTLVNLLNERARVSLDIGAAKRQMETPDPSGR